MTPEEKRKQYEYWKAYRLKNRDRIRAAKRAYHQANKERILAKVKQWAKENPDRVAKNKRRHAERHSKKIKKTRHTQYLAARDTVIARSKKWKEAHPERSTELSRRHNRIWRANNPEQNRAHAVNRRARTAGNGGSHTAEDLAVLFEKQGHKCATPWCRVSITKTGRTKYHVDHVLPIKLGGSSDPVNLQLLCKKCNLRKNAKHPDQWFLENAGRL